MGSVSSVRREPEVALDVLVRVGGDVDVDRPLADDGHQRPWVLLGEGLAVDDDRLPVTPETDAGLADDSVA